MNTELFHPAPEGLPVAIRPSRGSSKMLNALERCDWNSLGNGRNGELLRAGALWLYGFLDESHSIAQGIDSPEGSYWHALMHRSEGDFSNSKYWYRRVGRHAIFPALLVAVRQQILALFRILTPSPIVTNRSKSLCRGSSARCSGVALRL